MIVEFGRVYRGVVWHVLTPRTPEAAVGSVDAPICGETKVVDVVQAQALSKGRVCPRCADVVDQLQAAVLRARPADEDAS